MNAPRSIELELREVHRSSAGVEFDLHGRRHLVSRAALLEELSRRRPELSRDELAATVDRFLEAQP